MFFVFRRNDGYVGAINSSTPESGRQALSDWRTPTGPTTFEILLETDDWDQALARIEAERAAAALAAVHADDRLLDELGAAKSDSAVVDDGLNTLLLAWRGDVDTEAYGELVDTATAVAVIAEARPKTLLSQLRAFARSLFGLHCYR